MLKVRLQGTKKDISWFLRQLERNKDMKVTNTSSYLDNKGTKQYKRVYTEVFRNDSENDK